MMPPFEGTPVDNRIGFGRSRADKADDAPRDRGAGALPQAGAERLLHNYFAVPTNSRAINSFYYNVPWYWRRRSGGGDRSAG
jgi:hypothetical protein